MGIENLVSLLGFGVSVGIAWCLSSNRKEINWRPVAGGIVLQFLIGGILFGLPFMRHGFVWVSNAFNAMLQASTEGVAFVFGSLCKSSGASGFILAFNVLPFIIIFASLMSFLYYIKVIPFIIQMFARFLASVLKTSGAESLCAASNVFVGVESTTGIKPYLATMTRSELFIVLVAGMSTIASSVLALYVSFLKGVFPNIAGHLVSASILSVPATFVIAKLMIPETEEADTANETTCELHVEEKSESIVESFLNGANNGAKLAMGVGVALIAFLGILGIVKAGWGYCFGEHYTIHYFLAKAFTPLTWLLGVPSKDVSEVAGLLGTRLIETEIPSYLKLAKLAAAHKISERSVVIASYALCGFTHIASVAIFVGGASALAPSRKADLARLGPRALLAATLVTLMTGAIAGVFYFGQSGILGIKAEEAAKSPAAPIVKAVDKPDSK